MGDLLKVSSNPHIRSKVSTDKIMLCVIIALLPATVWGTINFGMHGLVVVLTSVASCVLTELVYELLLKKEITVGDLSAVVTGLLLGLNMPPEAPLKLPIIGGIFGILVVKMLFGGLGQNFMNPALGARCFLVISYTARMTNFNYDGMTEATPLALIKNGSAVNLMDMFLGKIPGTIGEVSTLAILIGAIVLIVFNIIDFRIPLAYIVTFIIFMGLFSGHGWSIDYMAAELCGGGLMLGAFFMATDYVTSPITKSGRIIFGIACGVFTGIFRCFSSSAEGVSYAIIICNLLVPLIEKITMPKCFGKGGEL